MKAPQKWILAAGLAFAAVTAGYALSFQAYQMLVIALILLIAIPVAFIIQTRSHTLGLAALIVTAVALPVEFTLPSGVVLSSPFFLAAYICASWALLLVVSRRRAAIDSARVVLAAIAFIAVSLTSFVAGQYPWFPIAGAPLGAQLTGLTLFLLSVGLFLVLGHQINHLVQLRQLTWLFLGAGALVCLGDVIPAFGMVSHWTNPGTLGSLFWTWLVALSFSQAALNRRLSLFVRISLFSLTALVLYRGLFLAFSWASGWLPPLVALGVVLFFVLPRFSLSLALFGLPAGLFLASKVWTLMMANEQYSYVTRLEAWQIILRVVERSPLIGLGPANYNFYTAFFPFRGWYARFCSHNNYMDLLAQTGFLGLLAFCWFAFEIVHMGWRLRSLVPPGFARAYVIGTIGGLVGTLVSGMLADWIIPFYYNIGIQGFRSSLLFWVFAGGILALKRMVPARVSVDVPETQQAVFSCPVLTGVSS